MQNFAKYSGNVHKDFPYSIRPFEGEIHKKLVDEFQGQPEGVVKIGDDDWIMPTKFRDFADQIYNFEVRPDDVFICTYPRSGTTWTQEMIWLIGNDLDYETASKYSLLDRFPFFE